MIFHPQLFQALCSKQSIRDSVMGSNDSIKIDVNSNKDIAQLEYKSLSTIRCFKMKLCTEPEKKEYMQFSGQSKKEHVQIN